jgi:hypothetical protein
MKIQKNIKLTEEELTKISNNTEISSISYFCGNLGQYMNAHISKVKMISDKAGLQINCDCGVIHEIITK